MRCLRAKTELCGWVGESETTCVGACSATYCTIPTVTIT